MRLFPDSKRQRNVVLVKSVFNKSAHELGGTSPVHRENFVAFITEACLQKRVNRWVEVSHVSGALDCIQQDVNPLWRYMARSEEGQWH